MISFGSRNINTVPYPCQFDSNIKHTASCGGEEGFLLASSRAFFSPYNLKAYLRWCLCAANWPEEQQYIFNGPLTKSAWTKSAKFNCSALLCQCWLAGKEGHVCWAQLSSSSLQQLPENQTNLPKQPGARRSAEVSLMYERCGLKVGITKVLQCGPVHVNTRTCSAAT